jgi:hypothetical protein
VDALSTTIYEVRPARLLTAGALVWSYAFGLLLGLFVLVAIVWISFQPLTPLTYIVPVLAIAAATLCLPIGFGNPYIRRLASRIKRANPANGASLVQIAMQPRLRSGVRAALEDADDIGWLAVTDSGLIYEGDAITMTLPLSAINKVELQNVGFRGVFMYGPRIVFTVSGIQGVQGFEAAERSSLFLPQSRGKAISFYHEVLARQGSARR